MGKPKGLLRTADSTPWVALAATALTAGGCDPVLVVTGARGDEVASLVPPPARVVPAPHWASGMSASLRAGLRAARSAVPDLRAVVVTLVDLPGMTSAAVARLVAASSAGPSVLARAAYDGVPGHPVLLGAEHLEPVIAQAAGDSGARPYLATRPVTLVECADVADGTDVDQWPTRPR